MGSERLSSSVLSDEVGSLWGQIRTVVRIGELHLVLRIVVVKMYSCVWTIRWWPVVGGASRNSWYQRSINVIIKGCIIKRSLDEDVNVGLTIGFYIRVMSLKSILYCMLHFFLLELTLFVCVWR